MNWFGRPLPKSLSRCTYLEDVSLSHNCLEGILPLEEISSSLLCLSHFDISSNPRMTSSSADGDFSGQLLIGLLRRLRFFDISGTAIGRRQQKSSQSKLNVSNIDEPVPPPLRPVWLLRPRRRLPLPRSLH